MTLRGSVAGAVCAALAAVVLLATPFLERAEWWLFANDPEGDRALAREIDGAPGAAQTDPTLTYSARPALEWHFAVIESDVVNAFSCPGGFIFITTGGVGATFGRVTT